MARVLVGIPMWKHDSEPSSRTYNCLKAMKANSSHALEFFYARGQQITQNSLQICLKVLQEGWDYLLYTGDDITFPPQALDRMISLKKDIVGGLCTWKSPPYWTTGAMECEDGRLRIVLVTPDMVKQRAVVEVDAVGSGFMLVSRKALEAVDDYFRNRLYPAIPDEFKWASPTPYFPVTYNPMFNSCTGSDWSFCRAAKRAGCEVYLDCGVVCGHQWEHAYTIEDHWRWLEKYTFNSQLPLYPGQPLDPVGAPKNMVYWGDAGAPMDVTVTSLSDQERAINDVYPILKASYVPVDDLSQAGMTSAGYIVGFGMGEKGLNEYLQWGKRYSKVGIHWNFEDAKEIPRWMNRQFKKTLDNGHYVHMAEDENTELVLREHFKEVHRVGIPSTRQFPVAPFPESFTVAVMYTPDHEGVVEEIVKAHPEVKFRFFKGVDDVPFNYPNMLFAGQEPYAHDLARSSAMLTLVDRPSPKRMLMSKESAMMGRNIITNFDMPFSNRIPEHPEVTDVSEVLERLKGVDEENPEMVKYYFEDNDVSAYRKRIGSLLGVKADTSPKRMWHGAVG